VLLLRWYLWMLLMDDRIDNGSWALDGKLPEFAREAVAGTGADPMLRVLADELWPEVVRLGGTRLRTALIKVRRANQDKERP